MFQLTIITTEGKLRAKEQASLSPCILGASVSDRSLRWARAALHLVTREANVHRYGIELDAERAQAAGSNDIEIHQGNTFDALARSESF
jgi:hypothetical protein